MATTTAPKIAVLGSINMDLVVRCAELPQPGQTILADSSAEFCGGKGANQAVAAALAGGEVSMIGAVGSDAFADRLLENLRHHRINCSAVERIHDTPSGLAVISVDQHAQNSIVVVPGANACVTNTAVANAKSTIQQSDLLLVQLEIPVESVLAGIQIARQSGVRVILDPAPVLQDFPDDLLDVDLICPNETEAAALTGKQVRSVADAGDAAVELSNRGARNVAVTMGDQGTLLRGDDERDTGMEPRPIPTTLIPTFPIDAVDTTAAGDAFAGALAVRWSLTNDLQSSIRFANAAGALAASNEGAQASMASLAEIEKLWNTPI